jgi:predicted transport protein
LTNNILNKFPEILHKPIGRYYCFYRGRISSRSRFVAIILHKNDISIRIRADPKTLSDPKNLLKEKVYKGWFFGHGRGQEREFKVTDKGQLNYAMELIKQSYDSAK